MSDEKECYVLAVDPDVARLVAQEEAAARDCRAHPLTPGELPRARPGNGMYLQEDKPLLLVVESYHPGDAAVGVPAGRLEAAGVQKAAPWARVEAVSGTVPGAGA